MLFDHPDFDDHEQVVFCSDVSVGLSAIIAVHDTSLGPAAGGCRMQPYQSVEDALTDVLRLSQGMTLKNAIAGLSLGGGKCVIIADPADPAKPELLRAFSHHVQHLAGRYWTAIDVGVGPADAEVLAENCDFIFSNPSQYPDGYEPVAFTSLGGFVSIKAAAAHVWGSDGLHGRRVAIQGVGAAGSGLAALLHEAGAELVVADISAQSVDAMVTQFGATAVDPGEIHAQDVDVFAPCALGAIVNDTTIPHIQARIICGLANNQLAEPRHGDALREAGITYVPDYVANGGGICAAGTIIYSNPTLADMREKVLGINDTVGQILRLADEQDRPTSSIADELAASIVARAHS